MPRTPLSPARSTLLLTGVGLVAQLLGFFYRVALARLIGTEVMGLYQLIMPVYAILLSLTVTGPAVGVSSLTAGCFARGDRTAVGQLLRIGLTDLLMLWIPVALSVLAFSQPLALLIGDGRTRWGLILLLPVLLLTGVENLTKHHFYGMNEVCLPAGVELGEQFVRTAAVLGLVWFFHPQEPAAAVGLIVLGMLCSEIFSSCSLTLLRRRRETALPPKPAQLPRLRHQLVQVAFPVGMTALLGNLIASANTVLLPRKLMETGLSQGQALSRFGVLFGMTLPMLTLPNALISALCLVLVPRLRSACADGCRDGCRAAVERALLAVSTVTMPYLALLLPLSEEFSGLLFPGRTASAYLLPLAVGTTLGSYEMVLGSVLNGMGAQNAAAAISLFCGGMQLVCTVAGRGLEGFLFGLIVFSAAGLWLRLRQAAAVIGGSFNGFAVFFAPALASVLAGITVRLLRQGLITQGCSAGITLFSCLVVGLFLYSVTLNLLGIDPLRLLMREDTG